MSWLENLIRPDLRDFAAYRSARSEGPAVGVQLDANESPWPPAGKLAAEDRYHRYPSPQPPALRQRVADLYEVSADQILLTRGSDEGIDVLMRLFCRAGQDDILICPPTFGMYEVAARVQGAAVLKVGLRADGQLDLPAIIAACTPRTKLIFIPSPNAPMGHLMSQQELKELCQARAETSLVVVDEAYVEFTENPQGMIPFLRAAPNLVVLRTMSKAHALAGERVGCVIASPEIVANLAKIIAPYPLPQSSIRAAMDALSAGGLILGQERRRTLVLERARLARYLAQSEFVELVYPSDSNFLLLRTTASADMMKRMLRFGIRARDRAADIPQTVRISVGTREENDLVLECFGVADAAKADPAAEQRNARLFSVQRGTKETQISVAVNLDSPNFLKIASGIGFFDHMLAQLAVHGGFGLALECAGDLHIDQHHSVEDCAIALGEALGAALGDKRGIARFGFSAPLDEALAEIVLDLSGRPYFSFTGTLPGAAVGELSTEMVPHFFRSLAMAMNAALHIKVTGENTHHMVEACFKATGRAMRQAFRYEGQGIPSTKGVL